MILFEYIKFWYYDIRLKVKKYCASNEYNKLRDELDGLKYKIEKLEELKKPKHRIKNGKIELEE